MTLPSAESVLQRLSAVLAQPTGNIFVSDASQLLALAIHSIMLENSFVTRETSSINDTLSRDASSINFLPSVWNLHDTFTFTYSHPYSRINYQIKMVNVGSTLMVNAFSLSNPEKIFTISLLVDSVVAVGKGAWGSSLVVCKNSFTDIDGLIKLIQESIIDLFLPFYCASECINDTEQPVASGSNDYLPKESAESILNIPPPSATLPSCIPAGMIPPHAQRYPPSFSIGDVDRDPATALIGDPSRSPAGMLIGPGHPGFFPRHGGYPRDRFPDPSSILPPGTVPPGARFDPILPPPLGPDSGLGTRPDYRYGEDDPYSQGVHASGDPDSDLFLPPGAAGPSPYPFPSSGLGRGGFGSDLRDRFGRGSGRGIRPDFGGGGGFRPKFL